MIFKNKTALITGSTSGIGLAIANDFAAKGANLVINGLGNKAELDKICEQIIAKHSIACIHSNADMLVPEEIRNMIVEGTKYFGSIDILVNNAGIQFVSPLWPPNTGAK
jgi:3-hydroxybutyrate dehydrogenase